MTWFISLKLKHLRRLTLQRHYFEQLSYLSPAQIDAEAADAMKRKAEMRIVRLTTHLLKAGLTQTELADYLATSREVRLAREKALQARRMPIGYELS